MLSRTATGVVPCAYRDVVLSRYTRVERFLAVLYYRKYGCFSVENKQALKKNRKICESDTELNKQQGFCG